MSAGLYILIMAIFVVAIKFAVYVWRNTLTIGEQIQIGVGISSEPLWVTIVNFVFLGVIVAAFVLTVAFLINLFGGL